MKNKLLVIIITVAVIGVVAGGFWLIGSPSDARKAQNDSQRLSDLQNIYNSIDSYYYQKRALPGSIEVLKNSPNYYVPSIKDPQTKQPYTYTILTDRSYQLCATFETTSNANDSLGYQPYYGDSTFWQHTVGNKCFTLEVSTPETNTSLPAPAFPDKFIP